jgi:hypothetical protein
VSQILDMDAVAESPDPHAMLLADLADFVTRNRSCGQLTGDATELEASGYLVTASCSCGVGVHAVGDAGCGGSGSPIWRSREA